MLMAGARLLRAIRTVHRRLLPASGAKSQPAWASPSGHPGQYFNCFYTTLTIKTQNLLVCGRPSSSTTWESLPTIISAHRYTDIVRSIKKKRYPMSYTNMDGNLRMFRYLYQYLDGRCISVQQPQYRHLSTNNTEKYRHLDTKKLSTSKTPLSFDLLHSGGQRKSNFNSA